MGAHDDLLELQEHATERQWELLRAVHRYDSPMAAARALEIGCGTITSAIRRVRAKAATAAAGGIPMDDGTTDAIERSIPAGARLTGTSLYTTAENGDKIWIKTKQQQQSAGPEEMMAAFERAFDGWKPPRAPAQKTPKNTDEDKLTVYPMGDPHVGMLSWKQESGVDWDLSIAEQVLTEAASTLVEMAPDSAQALIINLGDFFHADDQRNVTPGSGNQLDVDGRQGKIIDAGLRIMGTNIERALTKHARVKVINVRGNHDPGSALWLSRCLRERYRNNPNVEVETSPAWRGYMQFGVNMFGYTHGNGPKLAQLPGKMAAEAPEMWGRTLYRKWFVGHYHHSHQEKFDGCDVEIYETLAGRDGWHAKEGYIADRGATIEVYHRRVRGSYTGARVTPSGLVEEIF